MSRCRRAWTHRRLVNNIARHNFNRGKKYTIKVKDLSSWLPAFQRSKSGSFYQEAPSLGNQFSEDFFLQSYLKSVLPQKVSLFNSQLPLWHLQNATITKNLSAVSFKL